MSANILKIILFSSLCIIKSKSEYFDNDAQYECSQPLLDQAVIVATSSLTKRGPENARLHAGIPWTAKSSDFQQKLTIDLGSIRNITAIATQGSPQSDEFVTEFTISYGSNGIDYADFLEPGGNIKMFKGNTDVASIQYNVFEVPIIAQWIRINPTRWENRISLRMELYGCEYVSNVLHFTGKSLTRLDLLRSPLAASYESIRFRFKTSYENGVILYSRGTQGDLIALELKNNKMVLNIDLGSGLMTSLSVGSLLDNNFWHDVLISRNQRDIIFSVDRVIVNARIKGEFNRLNLDRGIYIGGVPNIQKGISVQQNYTGCIENLYFNSSNFIRDMKYAFEIGQSLRFQTVNTLYRCPESPMTPVTFLTRSSFTRMSGYEGMTQLNVSFSFRTYEDHGLMMYHKFKSRGYVKMYLEFGKVKIDIKTSEGPRITLDNYDMEFNDGRWHSVMLTISHNNLVLDIDQWPMVTTRLLDMITSSVYFIGGIPGSDFDGKGKSGFNGKGRDGFIGCMKGITIDGNYKIPAAWKEDEFCCKDEIVMDACHMTDRCNPNPCQNSGVCRQNADDFFCDCTNTGYVGAVCHAALYPLSCHAYKNLQSVQQKANIHIDVDGSGPLKPFPVTCEYYTDGRIVTVLNHNNEQTTSVDGFQEAGSFEQNITYDASLPQIEALLHRSTRCWQHLSYECKSSRLLDSSYYDDSFHPYSWWVSRHNRRMDYWAGGLTGSRKCNCGVLGNCIDPTKWCNCDANRNDWQEDSGEIQQKEHLPVKAVRIGDTGTPLDEKQGRFTLGPLMCEGDDLFSNVVTFRVPDATINLPPFDMENSGDIYFEFKTTIENAVFFHAEGPTDYIKLSIIGGSEIQFQFRVANGPRSINLQTSYHLNDNQWHSVSVERNRKEVRVVVDSSLRAESREPPGPFRAIHLTSEMIIGANIDNREGFLGCIRTLLLNGKLIDLKSYAQHGLYGISTDCVGQCNSNPCLNNGTCHERYDGYTCDCRFSSFKGPICADEIGVNLRSTTSLKYDFLGSWRSTIAENIRIGFTTTNPQGFLLSLSSNISGDYLTMMISNSGNLRVIFDFGFERQEIIYPDKNFALGQFHDVRFSRKNSGSTVVLTVDNYKPKEYHLDIKGSADAQFKNIQYMYIGKNESMHKGFIGCVSRVEFDDIYPLKLLFQENGPPNVKSLGTKLNEDFCGVEPVTHAPNEVETRPPPIIDEDKLRKAYSHEHSAVLGVFLAVSFVILVVGVILFDRHQYDGKYVTQEDKDADIYKDPDEAVINSVTGPLVTKRQEWFV